MPYYGGTATTRGITMVSRIVPTYAAGAGYSLLATCPSSRSWEVKTVWIQNHHSTQTFQVALSRVPATYLLSPGTLVSDAALRVFKDIKLKPAQFLVLNATLGLRSGDALWGYQLESTTGDITAGIGMLISGVEVG